MADPQSDIREAIESTRAELSERLDALSDRAARVASDTISEGTKRAKASRRQVGRQAERAHRRAARALPDASTLSDAKARLGDVGGWAADSTTSVAAGGRKAKARATDAGRTAKVKGRKAKAEARQAAAVAQNKTRSGGRNLGRLVLMVGAAAAVVIGQRRKH